MANRYIEGKTDECSSKRAWSSIGEQYPEGLTRGVLQVHKHGPGRGKQSPNGRQRVNPIYKAEGQEHRTTRKHEKTRLTTKIRIGN